MAKYGTYSGFVGSLSVNLYKPGRASWNKLFPQKEHRFNASVLEGSLVISSYKKTGFKDSYEVPRQYTKWWIQNTTKYCFPGSKWIFFPHLVNCHSLYPRPLSYPLSSGLELLSLNSLPQTFCALKPYQAVTDSWGTQPTQYPLNTSHAYTQAVSCTKTLFSLAGGNC